MIKKIIFSFFFFYSVLLHSQVPGQWVWKGGSTTINYTGSFGIKGVPDSANKPPAMYEAIEWTDNQGNFWLYGGTHIGGFLSDLWKYNPVSNQWTWMHGPGFIGASAQPAIYGTTGVPDVNNTPGIRSTSYSWKDNQGNLWLFGGIGLDTVSGGGQQFNDLWKYDIGTNQWTFMKGDKGPGSVGHFGTKGVEDILNRPGSVMEMGIAWTSNDGDLWLLDAYGCLWRYNILTNNWTWKKGNYPSASYPSTYGVKGVPNTNNTPGGSFFDYTRWKDSQGNFWYYHSKASGFKILWKYDISLDMWTWIDGDTTFSSSYNYGLVECDKQNNINPLFHFEARACWIDPCDNLWLMGGESNDGVSMSTIVNDLIYFDTQNLKWVWVDNSYTEVPSSNYGTLGVSSATNEPSSRSGAMPFMDLQGNLWLYGGANFSFSQLADLWSYTIDTTCTMCNLIYGINENANTNSISVYPNPTSGFFTFSGLKENSKIEIYDVIGRVIFSTVSSDEKSSIDISNYPKGIYFYQIIDKNNRAKGKIVHQ